MAPQAPGAINVTVAQLTFQELLDLITAGPQSAVVALATLMIAFGSPEYNAAALESAVIPATNVAGRAVVNFNNTGATPGNLQFPTATDLLAALPAGLRVVGYSYTLNIRNSAGGASTATITTNTGITLTGTMTIDQNVTRTFVVTVTGVDTPAVTVQSMGISAAGA